MNHSEGLMQRVSQCFFWRRENVSRASCNPRDRFDTANNLREMFQRKRRSLDWCLVNVGLNLPGANSYRIALTSWNE